MAQYEVAPLPDYIDAILKEYEGLSLPCADGLHTMIERLGEREPSLRDRCGLMADRHELYAITLPDCPRRALVVSIDARATPRPRVVHGTLAIAPELAARARDLARSQLGLINPTWEPAR